VGIRYAAVARLGNAVWILGGERSGQELDEVLRWDPRTGTARTAGRLPGPLGHESVAVVGERLLVMGGRTAPETVTDRMWWFRPRTGRWRAAGRLPYPVADAPTVALGRHAYLLGGESPAFTDRVTEVGWR
jgi:N-acetylneuraminic acid mutarotase